MPATLPATESDTATTRVERESARMFSIVFRQYAEASDAVQQVIRDMVDLLNDESVDSDDRDMALETLREALFPVHHNGELGAAIEDMCEVEHREFADERAALEQEQATFADRLRSAMDDRGITQAALADSVGLGQPAIAMMLSRKCRPQRRTVERMADALGLKPEDLWPPTAAASV